MAVLDEPNTLDPGHDNVLTMPNEHDSDSKDSKDSKGFDLEILDGGSDTDIREETELIKFSRMLCDAQEKAQEKEKAKDKKRKTYDRRSRTTAYRWKRYRSDLAAQGYLPVHEFMKQMDTQKRKDELTTSQELTIEESEESSDDDAATESQPGNSEPRMSEGMEVEELAPAASGDCHQVAASGYRRRVSP
jgi:hypothetical protein